MAANGPASGYGDDGTDALNAKQTALVEALAAGMSLIEASTATGIAYRTCRRWRRRPEIKSAIREHARDAVQAGTLALGQGASTAAQTLRAIAAGKEAAEGPRVSACRAILEIGLRVLEVDELTERVEQLETQLREHADKPGTSGGWWK
jgi:hypothetical protein